MPGAKATKKWWPAILSVCLSLICNSVCGARQIGEACLKHPCVQSDTGVTVIVARKAPSAHSGSR